MTKTLTEQWREGKLPEGWYYLRLEPNFENRYDIVYNLGIDFDLYNTEDIEEVLAPVPSYEEWKCAKENLDKNGTWYTERSYKLIEKKLEIATKAVKEIQEYTKEYSLPSYTGMICHKALKEMEGVK